MCVYVFVLMVSEVCICVLRVSGRVMRVCVSVLIVSECGVCVCGEWVSTLNGRQELK